MEVGTGFEPVYTDLQSVASPLGQPTVVGWVCRDPLRADDEARTRDLNLGKVALYQLSHVRVDGHYTSRPRARTGPRIASAAAEYAGVHPVTLRRWVAAGRLPAYRVGPRLLKIDLDDLESIIRPIPVTSR